MVLLHTCLSASYTETFFFCNVFSIFQIVRSFHSLRIFWLSYARWKLLVYIASENAFYYYLILYNMPRSFLRQDILNTWVHLSVSAFIDNDSHSYNRDLKGVQSNPWKCNLERDCKFRACQFEFTLWILINTWIHRSFGIC